MLFLFWIVQRPVVDIKNRPRIPIPDEDPYSVAGNGSGGSSGSSGFGHNSALINQHGNNNISNNNNSNSSNGHLQQQLSNQQEQQQQQHPNMTMNGNSNGNITSLHLNNGHHISGHMAAKREQLLMQTQQQLAHKRNEKPPKLPPRDNGYGHDIPKVRITDTLNIIYFKLIQFL